MHAISNTGNVTAISSTATLIKSFSSCPPPPHLKHNQTVLLHDDDTEIFMRMRNLSFGTQEVFFLTGNSTETSRTTIASNELHNGFLS